MWQIKIPPREGFEPFGWDEYYSAIGGVLTSTVFSVGGKTIFSTWTKNSAIPTPSDMCVIRGCKSLMELANTSPAARRILLMSSI